MPGGMMPAPALVRQTQHLLVPRRSKRRERDGINSKPPKGKKTPTVVAMAPPTTLPVKVVQALKDRDVRTAARIMCAAIDHGSAPKIKTKHLLAFFEQALYAMPAISVGQNVKNPQEGNLRRQYLAAMCKVLQWRTGVDITRLYALMTDKGYPGLAVKYFSPPAAAVSA